MTLETTILATLLFLVGMACVAYVLLKARNNMPTFRQYSTDLGMAQFISKKEKCYGLFLSWVFDSSIPPDELKKAAPFLTDEQVQELWANEMLFLYSPYDTSVYFCFYQTVGDDGPTNTNHYDGPARVYAVVIDKNGNLMTENT